MDKCEPGTVWQALAGQVGSVAWVTLVAVVVYAFRGQIRDRIGGIRSLKALGVEVEFREAERALGAATSRSNATGVASTVDKTHLDVRITEADQARVIARAGARRTVLAGKRILWLDDEPDATRLERTTLAAFGLVVDPVTSDAAALDALKAGRPYDLLLSDLKRGGDTKAGLTFLRRLADEAIHVPVIFYVTSLDRTRPVPAGAFGLTNRPDELMHLVMDALEREA